jgi:ubiquinone/menaquinone biosynthesis C-methylase UbiE
MKRQDAHFDDVAHEYEGSIPTHVMDYLVGRRVAMARSLVHEGRVLDVGCGTGRFLEDMPADRYQRVGIDVSEGMLAQAREKGLQVLQASGADLPFPDDSFDLVVTFAVLHHLIDPEVVRKTIEEIARVTKPGGAAIVWDHNPLNPYWRFLMARLPQDQGDEKLVRARVILDAMHGAGVRQVTLRRLTFTPEFTPERALPAVSRLERVLERTPGLNLLAAHNVAVARL